MIKEIKEPIHNPNLIQDGGLQCSLFRKKCITRYPGWALRYNEGWTHRIKVSDGHRKVNIRHTFNAIVICFRIEYKCDQNVGTVWRDMVGEHSLNWNFTGTSYYPSVSSEF